MPTDQSRLEQRLAELEHHVESTRRLHRRLGVGLVALVLFGVGSAFAANGACPNGLPFCFNPDEPARASDVNTNFLQLKEWLEAKTGLVSSNGISTATAASFTGGVTMSGATTLSSGAVVNGGRLIINSGLTLTGYQVSCAEGDNTTNSMQAPYCCRINVRNGAVSCKLASNGNLAAWTAGADPFSATTEGYYSLSCYRGVGGLAFPGCCRAELGTGVVECKYANNWALSGWSSGTNAF